MHIMGRLLDKVTPVILQLVTKFAENAVFCMFVWFSHSWSGVLF